jgi:hypothetical protein
MEQERYRCLGPVNMPPISSERVVVFASGSPGAPTVTEYVRHLARARNLVLNMSPDMTSVRESCVTSLRNRDTAWHCAWIRTPALHLSQGLTSDKPQLPSDHPTNRTPVLRIEKRLHSQEAPPSDCRCGSGYRHRTDLPAYAARRSLHNLPPFL